MIPGQGRAWNISGRYDLPIVCETDIVLMVHKSGRSPIDAVDIPVCIFAVGVLAPSQVVVWDF